MPGITFKLAEIHVPIFFIGMSNETKSKDGTEWINELSDLEKELSKTETGEILFLCKDYLPGTLYL